MSSEATSEIMNTTTSIENTENTTVTMEPGTTMVPTEITTIQSNCTDVKPSKKCKRWSDKIVKDVGNPPGVWIGNKCKKSLKKWLNKLSAKEVCGEAKIMTTDEEIEDAADDEMDPIGDLQSCKDTWTKRKCKRIFKKLNKRFNKLAKKCSKTASELKEFLLMDDFDC